jgi:Mechanosensitive ion channel, conserved TM helix
MKEVFDELLHSIGAYLPNLLGALAILVVGWLVAFLIAALVRAILRRTTLDNKLARTVFGRDDTRGMPIEDAVARSVLLVIGVFVLLAFFEALRLTAIAEPIKTLLNSVFAYLPRIVGALALVLLAWLVATVLRRVMLAVMDRTKLDEHIGGEVKGKGKPLALGKTLAEVVYWLTFLLFLPGILDALALQGPLEPVKALLNRVSEFMPNVLGAALIVIIGWFIARLVQRVVGNLLAAAGTDQVGERLGVAEALGERKLSGVIALVAYVLILIPVLIAALNALKLDAVTQPASQMLGTILDAIPAVFGAVVILVIAYAVARVVSTLASSLLAGAGFDNVLARLGLTKARIEGASAPSAIVGVVVMVTIMVFATIEAARMLKFDMFADMLRQVLEFGAHVLLGLVIFALGMFLANIVAKAVSESDTPRASVLANTARIAILVLAGAMALRQMNVANDIIQLAFGLILGAVAVAVALAFGLGGRDSAARLIEEWRHGTKGK